MKSIVRPVRRPAFESPASLVIDHPTRGWAMLQAFESSSPQWDGVPADPSLVSVAERGVRASVETDDSSLVFDEFNGLLTVLAGSMIVDMLRRLGYVVRRQMAQRSMS